MWTGSDQDSLAMINLSTEINQTLFVCFMGLKTTKIIQMIHAALMTQFLFSSSYYSKSNIQ